MFMFNGISSWIFWFTIISTLAISSGVNALSWVKSNRIYYSLTNEPAYVTLFPNTSRRALWSICAAVWLRTHCCLISLFTVRISLVPSLILAFASILKNILKRLPSPLGSSSPALSKSRIDSSSSILKFMWPKISLCCFYSYIESFSK